MRKVALLFASVAATSCTLVTNLDGLTGERLAAPADGGDGGALADADGGGSGSDAADAAPAASFLTNGGFEAAPAAAAACGAPWDRYRSILTKDPTARSGAFACRVCKEPGAAGTSYTLDYGYPSSPAVTAGVTYHAQAWVRAVPGATASQQLMLTISVYTAGGNEIDTATSAPIALSAAWAPIDFEYKVTKSGLFNLYVNNEPSNAGDCFLIDDVTAFPL